jgi:site-specific DNA recombinase
MAQQGGVNVLSGAPYGYRYVKKSDTSAAFYEVVEAEAKVVRMVFETYTQQGLSINAIARLLNKRQKRVNSFSFSSSTRRAASHASCDTTV